MQIPHYFLLEKCENLLQCNIYVLNCNETLTIDVVNFEQPGPDCDVLIHDGEAGVN